jgi:hypothetical protein
VDARDAVTSGLADLYGVAQTTINAILQGKTRRHVL